MMFNKYIALLALPILAAATPAPGNSPTTNPKTTVTITATPTGTLTPGQCNTGPIQCCNSVQSSSNPVVSTLLGLLGVVVQGVNVPIGLTCNPISVIGIGGNSCSAQPVCCQNNNFNGIVALGCTPVNANL